MHGISTLAVPGRPAKQTGRMGTTAKGKRLSGKVNPSGVCPHIVD